MRKNELLMEVSDRLKKLRKSTKQDLQRFLHGDRKVLADGPEDLLKGPLDQAAKGLLVGHAPHQEFIGGIRRE